MAVFFGLYTEHSYRENALFVSTPPVNETARDLAIELVLYNGLPLDNINRTFEYLSNPVFTDIRPRNHLTM